MKELLLTILSIYVVFIILYLDLNIAYFKIVYKEKKWSYTSRGFSRTSSKSLSMSVFKTKKFIFEILKAFIPVLNLLFYMKRIIILAGDRDSLEMGSTKDSALDRIINKKDSITSFLYK